MELHNLTNLAAVGGLEDKVSHIVPAANNIRPAIAWSERCTCTTVLGIYGLYSERSKNARVIFRYLKSTLYLVIIVSAPELV